MPNSNPSSMPQSPLRRTLDRFLLLIAGLGFVGFADSAYLTADHYLVLPLPCTITHGCATVLSSPYSMVGPIPLALFGALFYLVVMFFSLYLYTSRIVSLRHIKMLFALTITGFAMSLIFESIQVFIIHAICQYCALSALVSLCLFIAGIILVRKNTQENN